MGVFLHICIYVITYSDKLFAKKKNYTRKRNFAINERQCFHFGYAEASV